MYTNVFANTTIILCAYSCIHTHACRREFDIRPILGAELDVANLPNLTGGVADVSRMVAAVLMVPCACCIAHC